MMKNLLPIFFLTCMLQVSTAQTTILDFETTATSTVFQYFGSPLDGSLTPLIANPDPSGINVSDTVMEFTKPAVAEVWAGAFSNPNPQVAVDLLANNRVAVNVYMDHIGSVTLKLEASTDGGDNWALTVPNTQVNTWETLVFDVSALSIEAPFTAALGHTYERVVLFVDFGAAGTGEDVISYIDDIITLPPALVETIILDFEAPETSTGFQYFGSPLDGTFTQLIANPNPSGINVSDTVTEFIKPAVAEVWAGAFSNPNPTTPVTLDNGSQVCIKVHMDHIGNLALKLEQGVSGQPNWVTQVANTVVDEWTEICFDPTIPSIEAPFEAASGTYNRIVLFFDFGMPGSGEEVLYYFDDIIVKSSGAPQPRMISFKVDMNQYANNFDQVYLSGTFNNWSGDANPLEDPEFDGIWEGTIMVLNGAYEYKVTLDNWLGQESFGGFEECTKKDPSGQFVNRLLSVSGDAELPQFCFNSCYACGEEVNITFKVGMGDVPPSPDGVWLVGGGNFDVPGGKYKMNDDDADNIYEIVVPRKMGFSSFYAFANGACPDFTCKEDLSGLPCGDPDNFNDRFLEPVDQDSEVATCYGACNTNTECTTATAPIEKDDQVFNLYGNPVAQGYAMLDFGSDDVVDKFITVTNSLGQVVEHIVVKNSNTYMLQTSVWPVGMYLITVKVDNRFYTRKLVK